MRRLTAYISALCVALLLVAGVIHFTAAGEGYVVSGNGDAASERVAAGHTSADFSLQDSYAWYISPASDPSSVGSNANGGNAVNGARCSWLTGMRRELSSPVFQAADIFLTYSGRESSARSFASWRASRCGVSCGGAISVSRPGDGYVYALRRIVI